MWWTYFRLKKLIDSLTKSLKLYHVWFIVPNLSAHFCFPRIAKRHPWGQGRYCLINPIIIIVIIIIITVVVVVIINYIIVIYYYYYYYHYAEKKPNLFDISNVYFLNKLSKTTASIFKFTPLTLWNTETFHRVEAFKRKNV